MCPFFGMHDHGFSTLSGKVPLACMQSLPEGSGQQQQQQQQSASPPQLASPSYLRTLLGPNSGARFTVCCRAAHMPPWAACRVACMHDPCTGDTSFLQACRQPRGSWLCNGSYVLLFFLLYFFFSENFPNSLFLHLISSDAADCGCPMQLQARTRRAALRRCCMSRRSARSRTSCTRTWSSSCAARCAARSCRC